MDLHIFIVGGIDGTKGSRLIGVTFSDLFNDFLDIDVHMLTPP